MQGMSAESCVAKIIIVIMILIMIMMMMMIMIMMIMMMMMTMRTAGTVVSTVSAFDPDLGLQANPNGLSF